MYQRFFVLISLLVLLMATGCTSSDPTPVAEVVVEPTITIEPTETAVPPTETAVPTDTPEPTATATATSTATATATETAVPTNTPTPEPTETPLPTATLAPINTPLPTETATPSVSPTPAPPSRPVPSAPVPFNAENMRANVNNARFLLEQMGGLLDRFIRGSYETCGEYQYLRQSYRGVQKHLSGSF